MVVIAIVRLCELCMISQDRQARCASSNDVCGRCRVHVHAAAMCLCMLPTGIDLGTTMRVCHWDAVGNECVLREIGQEHYRAGVLKREGNLGHTKKPPNCRRSCDGSSVVVVISFSASQCCAAVTRSKRRRLGIRSVSLVSSGRDSKDLGHGNDVDVPSACT